MINAAFCFLSLFARRDIAADCHPSHRHRAVPALGCRRRRTLRMEIGSQDMTASHAIWFEKHVMAAREWLLFGLAGLFLAYVVAGASAILCRLLDGALTEIWAIVAFCLAPSAALLGCRLLHLGELQQRPDATLSDISDDTFGLESAWLEAANDPQLTQVREAVAQTIERIRLSGGPGRIGRQRLG